MHKKDWTSPETIEKLHVRKEGKSAVKYSQTRVERSHAQEQYSKTHKEVRSIRIAEKNLQMIWLGGRKRKQD